MNELNLTAKNMLNKLLEGRVLSTMLAVNATDIAASVKATGSYYLATTSGAYMFVCDDLMKNSGDELPKARSLPLAGVNPLAQGSPWNVL